MGKVKAFIALGSNLGDRRGNIEKAIEELKGSLMVEVVKVSKFYETDPVGGPPQDKFLDAAAEIRTLLTPHALLVLLRDAEGKVGRTPSKVKWGPREIDLDILLYNDLVMDDPDLVIPHPQLHLRRFMIEPLSEIAPEALHPILKKTAAEILEDLER
ncbi:MAG: 2-amino-4-hydroxy-6-hydroxymethyldihydropteridine diphosphokinase [Omnitrophica WOR_2 bacterium RIFCSPLOWO2_12_FULL_51_24]|nr:MAG: 2-amino-4-hydroxy-6-hydroxymethyldihydropteridine diphosphokinase [Omnitrophica WOR_2 bacterium RIFCSPHIGHO2_01_FULL_49_10]OGX33899.1 MAG: 2-amino-4-hydroxy-6-hydroxymethyldihydropteridine diphosphokinase [Omnitrophica WOR_2 bacterium RIFCSPLOWO2_02_FULL_50_19]OGX43812.1 MAG: 2-amino-4-hydroxy-6-hydroxymethyldihydropteridine diphosphokinase [Omnitrophica WOR_2 bacterium RIFCSPLOWO2_12_FULL_51_24]